MQEMEIYDLVKNETIIASFTKLENAVAMMNLISKSAAVVTSEANEGIMEKVTFPEITIYMAKTIGFRRVPYYLVILRKK